MSADKEITDLAKKIVFALDQARRVSSRDNPVHEVDLIAAGIADYVDQLRFEIQTRDQELAMLKAVYCTPGVRKRRSTKQAEVKKLIEQGMTYAEICDRTGIKSKSTIHRMAKE